MSYLMVQIAVFMALAAAVGFALGWVLRGLRGRARSDATGRRDDAGPVA